MPFFNEEEILKAKPRVKEENDWPIFRLREVTIRDITAKPASLFSADAHNKLSLDGLLKDPQEIDRYTLKYAASTPVHNRCDGVYVKNIDRFSYGRFEDGEPAFWAAGKAGWFEIEPSAKFKAIYEDMVEEIDVYYFAVDTYRHQNLKRLRKYLRSIESLFERYVEHTNGRCASPRDAEAIFRKHRKFIISNMAAGKEEIQWTRTPLYVYMKTKFRADWDPPRKVEGGLKTSNIPMPDVVETKKYTPIRKPHQGKSTSTLRPKGTKISKGLGKGKADEDVETTEEEGVATPTKRKVDIQLEEPTPKRATPSRHTRGSDLITDDKSLHPPEARKRLTLVETAIPGTAANGPGDSWRCEIDGCSHKVYAASTVENKNKIDDHYKWHAKKAESLIDLVLRESGRDQPATYLTAYIAYKESKKSAFEVANSDKVFPKPIFRQY